MIKPMHHRVLTIIVAAAALLVLALGAGRLREASGLRRPATLLAALGVALYQPFFFLGVDRTGVVVGTIVAIGTAPVVGGLLAWAYDRAPPTRTWLAATGVALAGVTMLVAAGADVGADAAGMAFAAMAGTAYATYVIAARQFSRAGDVVGATAVIFAIAAVLLLVAWFLQTRTTFGRALVRGIVMAGVVFGGLAAGPHPTVPVSDSPVADDGAIQNDCPDADQHRFPYGLAVNRGLVRRFPLRGQRRRGRGDGRRFARSATEKPGRHPDREVVDVEPLPGGGYRVTAREPGPRRRRT